MRSTSAFLVDKYKMDSQMPDRKLSMLKRYSQIFFLFVNIFSVFEDPFYICKFICEFANLLNAFVDGVLHLQITYLHTNYLYVHTNNYETYLSPYVCKTCLVCLWSYGRKLAPYSSSRLYFLQLPPCHWPWWGHSISV